MEQVRRKTTGDAFLCSFITLSDGIPMDYGEFSRPGIDYLDLSCS